MAANGISTLATKQARQVAKLEYAQAKRKGRVITDGGPLGTYGTWSDDGVDNDTVNYFRANNTYDITSLPNIYAGNLPADPDANPNPDGLLPKRPWIAVGTIGAPTSIEESVDGTTLLDLQVWYDSADTGTIVPSAIDESSVQQWTDKSSFAHNANPTNGNEKPTYENTVPLTTHGYIEMDGTEAFSINPVAWTQNLTGFTAFILANPTATSTGDTLLTTDLGDFKITYNGSSWTTGMNTGTGSVSPNLTTSGWTIFTMVYNAANPMVLRLNKTATTVTYTPPATSSGSNGVLYFGHDGTNPAYTGYIAEVILFDKALSSTEYQNIENYLNTKWVLGL